MTKLNDRNPWPGRQGVAGNYASYSIPELIIDLNTKHLGLRRDSRELHIQSIEFLISESPLFFGGFFQDATDRDKFFFVYRGPEVDGVMALQRVLKRLALGTQKQPSTRQIREISDECKSVCVFTIESADGYQGFSS